MFTVGAVHEPTGLEQLPTTPPELAPLLLLVPLEELVPEALLPPELVAPALPLPLPLPVLLEPVAPDPLPPALVEPPLVLPDAVDPEPPPELFVWPASVPPQLGGPSAVPQPAQTETIAKTGAARQRRAGAAGRTAALLLAICMTCAFAGCPGRGDVTPSRAGQKTFAGPAGPGRGTGKARRQPEAVTVHQDVRRADVRGGHHRDRRLPDLELVGRHALQRASTHPSQSHESEEIQHANPSAEHLVLEKPGNNWNRIQVGDGVCKDGFDEDLFV
jgi:hypothetical protein